MRMANRSFKLGRQLVPFKNYLLRMNRRDCLEWNFAVAGVLDIDDKLAPSTRDPAHGSNFLAAVNNEHLIAYLDIFVHSCCSLMDRDGSLTLLHQVSAASPVSSALSGA